MPSCVITVLLLDPAFPGSLYSLSLSPVAGPMGVPAPFDCTSLGGSSPPCFLCSYPRSAWVTFVMEGLGGPSPSEQIPDVCNLGKLKNL